MALGFKPSELPNPVLLTAPENLEFMRRKEAEAAAKETKKAGKKRKGKEVESEDEEPAPKKAKSTTGKSAGQKTATSSKASSTAATADEIFAVELEGDDDESVEIYDSCDEVRKKINVHLDVSGLTKAAFLRDIARAGWPSDPPKIQSKQLTDFQTKKGATSGSTSRVFYGAYCYFEKKRIAEGKPKSRHRQNMENQWPNGMEREREQKYIIPAGMHVHKNAYGKPVVR